MTKPKAPTRAQLDRIMSWGGKPTETTLPAWALERLVFGDGGCECCGAPLEGGVCVIGCEVAA